MHIYVYMNIDGYMFHFSFTFGEYLNDKMMYWMPKQYETGETCCPSFQVLGLGFLGSRWIYENIGHVSHNLQVAKSYIYSNTITHQYSTAKKKQQ